MLRIIAIALLLFSFGCSQGDETPPVSAAPDTGTEAATPPTPTPAKETAKSAAMETTTETAAETPASVQGCLDLVAAGRFAEAVPPCTLAVQQAPGNAEVQAALDKAKAGAASATQQAAADATSQATGAAASAQGAADSDVQKLGEGMGKALQ
jgi:hypothetical protein